MPTNFDPAPPSRIVDRFLSVTVVIQNLAASLRAFATTFRRVRNAAMLHHAVGIVECDRRAGLRDREFSHGNFRDMQGAAWALRPAHTIR